MSQLFSCTRIFRVGSVLCGPVLPSFLRLRLSSGVGGCWLSAYIYAPEILLEKDGHGRWRKNNSTRSGGPQITRFRSGLDAIMV